MHKAVRYGPVLILSLALMLGAFGTMLTNVEAYDINVASFGYGQHYFNNDKTSFYRAGTGAVVTSLGYPANVPWQDSHYRLSGSYNATVAFNHIEIPVSVSESEIPVPSDQASNYLWANSWVDLVIATAESYTTNISTVLCMSWVNDGKGNWEGWFSIDTSWMEWNRTMSTYRDGYVTFTYHYYIEGADMAMQKYYIAMDSTADELASENSISYFGLMLNGNIKFSYQNDVFGQVNQSTNAKFTATSAVVTTTYLGSLFNTTNDTYARTRVIISLNTENDSATYVMTAGTRIGINEVGGVYTNWRYDAVVAVLFPVSGGNLNATVQQQYCTANGTWTTLTLLNLTWGMSSPDLTFIPTFDLVASALGLTGAVGLLFSAMIAAVVFRRGATSMEAIGVLMILGIVSGTLVYVFLLGGV